MKNNFIKSFCVLTLLFGFLNSCNTVKSTTTISAKVAPTVKPNIIYIMADDLTTQAISAYGGIYKDIAPTPNIDKVAKEGMLFQDVLVTNAICGPSRAAILTGKYAHINGFYKNEGGGDFDGSQQTFPKLLQSAGYETAVIGKWHLGTAPTGFDYYKVLFNKEGQGTYFDPVFEATGNKIIEEKGKYSTTSNLFKKLFPERISKFSYPNSNLKDSLQYMIFTKEQKFINLTEKNCF